MKTAFLDRDGTIIEDYPDEVWRSITKPEFLNGSIEGMKKLIASGYTLIILTNQYLINEGIISESRYSNFTSLLLRELESSGIKILDVYYCPHRSDENCNCFKPNTGLFEKALNSYPEIDIEKSIMIGDSQCDLELAQNVGLKFHGLKGGSIRDKECLYESIEHIADVLLGIVDQKRW